MTIPFQAKPTVNTTNNSLVSASIGGIEMNSFQQYVLTNAIPTLHVSGCNITEESYNNLVAKITELGCFVMKHQSPAKKDSCTLEVLSPKECFFQFGFSLNNDKKLEWTIARYYGTQSFWDNHLASIVEPESIINQPSKVHWLTSFSNGRPNITDLTIDLPKSFDLTLYPSITEHYESLELFVQDYINSTANILILNSVPGMGKTTFLKMLMDATKDSCLVTYSSELSEMDELFAYFLTSDHKYLIIEDADTYMTSRDKDSSNHNMKKLLNVTDGLTARSDKKIIFTSNLPNIHTIDSALIRVGRCHKVLELRPLTIDQANTFYDRRGERPKLYEASITTGKAKFTVAELYGYINGYADEAVIKISSQTGAGFGRNVQAVKTTGSN